MGDDETDTLLAALANPTRMRIVRVLAGDASEGMPSGMIAERIGIPRNLMSSHLLVLSRAGVVTSSRQGRLNVYEVAAGRLEALADRLRGIVGD